MLEFTVVSCPTTLGDALGTIPIPELKQMLLKNVTFRVGNT